MLAAAALLSMLLEDEMSATPLYNRIARQVCSRAKAEQARRACTVCMAQE